MKKLSASFFFILCFCVFNFSQGTGSGRGDGTAAAGAGEPSAGKSKATPITILSKPRPAYTDVARENAVEGVVRLRIPFLASGEIGAVTVVTGLPYGLTEQAVEAAKKIKFTPAARDGQPLSATRIVEYSFSLVFGEEDKLLKENARILTVPAPEHPSEENLKKLGGKVTLELTLKSSGEVTVGKISTDLPKEFESKAREAASKITFKPAVHKNGNPVSQIKTITYEFKP